MPLRKPKGAARAVRPLKDAGQTTVEYVVVIAIIIGLGAALTAFAATEKGSIADATNSVGNMFSQLSGPAGGGSGGGDEGAGGSGGAGAAGGSGAGAGSEIETLAQKDPRDWTLDDQKAVAEDIAAKGEASPAYAKAKAETDAGTTWSVKLTNGKTMQYRIIGINHDSLANGGGKAGLTFLATNDAVGEHRMNASGTNAGGWEKSELRQKMSSGEIWNLMPSDFQTKVKSVTKLTNNVGGGSANKDAAVTATSDKLFPLSYSELAGTSSKTWSADSWIYNEGTRYEAFKDKVIDNSRLKGNYASWMGVWSERSVNPDSSSEFLDIDCNGSSGGRLYSNRNYSTNTGYIRPAFCF